MVKMFKYSVMAVLVLGLIAAGTSFMSSAALAQDNASKEAVGPGHEAENQGSRAETAMDFDKWMRKNPEARQQIEKDPSLLNNPDYLAKHPDLQQFMNSHPNFQRASAKNPDRMVRESRDQQRRAVKQHREHENNGRPVSTRQAKPR